MKCYIDGSCEPVNPGGRMGMGVYIEDLDIYLKDSIEPSYDNTNNVAEYLALRLLLNYLLDNNIEGPIHIYADSQLLVHQMNKKWRIKSGSYVNTAKQCKDLLKHFKYKITWIPREENVIADELSKGTL